MRFFNLKTNLIITGTCVACFFAGCAKAPDAKLAAAKNAIQAAKDAEADKYMAKNFQNLQKALEAAETKIATQKQGFILTRKYKIINQMLDKTIEMATELKTEAPKQKAAMVAQIKENLGLVDGMLKETANDIKKASKKRKQDKNAIKELKGILTSAESAAASAKTEFDAGNAFGASEKLDEVQQRIKQITDTLNPKQEG